MQHAGWFLFVLLCFSSCQKNTDMTTTYYLIRHAEKERGAMAGNDPELTDKGQQRAYFWATYFMGKNIEAVYSTNTLRTRETAAPTAEEFGVAIENYDPNDLYNEEFQEETLGQNVLIVGHSNTTPEFVNKIIGRPRYVAINDDEYGTVYRVVVKDGNNEVEKKLINNWDNF